MGDPGVLTIRFSTLFYLLLLTGGFLFVCLGFCYLWKKHIGGVCPQGPMPVMPAGAVPAVRVREAPQTAHLLAQQQYLDASYYPTMQETDLDGDIRMVHSARRGNLRRY